MWALMSHCDRCADAPFVSNRPRRRPSSPERASLRRFEESASPQINRRGSRARVTPVVRARVDARTTRSRKRAAVCSSECLAHEASIPEMLCGSPRSLPRARACGTRTAFAECLRGAFSVPSRISINSILSTAGGSDEFQFSLRPSKSTGRGTEPHAGEKKNFTSETKNRCCALGGDVRIGVGTAEQKQAPRDARRGYRRRRPAFSLVRSDRRRLGCSNLGRGRRDRFGGALPGRLRGRTKPRFFLFWHRVRHHGGPEARVHRGQGTWFSHARHRA